MGALTYDAPIHTLRQTNSRFSMIKLVPTENGDDDVLIDDKHLEVLHTEIDFTLAKCSLADLANESTESFPHGLQLFIESDDGFGTSFFHELMICSHLSQVSLEFRFLAPNKFWEGHYGLSTYIKTIHEQLAHHDNWTAPQFDVEDDWKTISLMTVIPSGSRLQSSILDAANDLKRLLRNAEIALSGLVWREEFMTNEDAFCRELLHPLLRRMGFLFVRYSHGKKEYGKDFTFSEITPFGNHRHYGLQAKAGDISGEVNAPIDELLGQLEDGFSMPYYEISSQERRYISTFIIAISGKFKENAREKIIEKMPKGSIGSVYFLDRERITELVDQYWKIKKS